MLHEASLEHMANKSIEPIVDGSGMAATTPLVSTQHSKGTQK